MRLIARVITDPNRMQENVLLCAFDGLRIGFLD
jgi:hypothetical protein